MKNYSPQIEIFPNNSFNLQSDLIQKPWFRSHRFINFVIFFLVSAVISLSYNYSRPAIYRSSATLLTSAITAVDRIAYLVRHGLRLSDLEQITGYLEPSVISSYSAYSPPQQGRSIEDIELLHPALTDIA